jgi:hypothetical protein
VEAEAQIGTISRIPLAHVKQQLGSPIGLESRADLH